MSKTWLIDWEKPLVDLPESQVIHTPAVGNAGVPGIYESAHIGLFPNRCEAGNNLVLCEFMATGRPVIVTDATGHRDVLTNAGPYRLTHGDIDPAGWFNPFVSDIIAHLEHAYQHREELQERGRLCREQVLHLTWRRTAELVFERFALLTQQRASVVR